MSTTKLLNQIDLFSVDLLSSSYDDDGDSSLNNEDVLYDDLRVFNPTRDLNDYRSKSTYKSLTNDQALNFLVSFLSENFKLVSDQACKISTRVDILQWVMDESRKDILGFNNCINALGLDLKYVKNMFIDNGIFRLLE